VERGTRDTIHIMWRGGQGTQYTSGEGDKGHNTHNVERGTRDTIHIMWRGDKGHNTHVERGTRDTIHIMWREGQGTMSTPVY
jgi:hypothetical protein